MPCFSVIITSFNYGRYIQRAIDSVLAQTFDDYELIVVDDGSTDDSIAKIQAYGDRLTLLQTDRWQQARAVLHAVARSRGRFISLLDADDEMLPSLLARVHAVAKPDVAKIQFMLVPIDTEGAVAGPAFPPLKADDDELTAQAAIAACGMYVSPQTSGNVFRRDVFDLIEPYTYETGIDGVTLLIAPYLGRLVSIPEPLARYRVHTANISFNRADPFGYQANRFKERLAHLARILQSQGRKLELNSAPADMFFCADRLALGQVRAKGRLSPGELGAYLRALVRKESPRQIAKLGFWALLSTIGPVRLRQSLFERRANPWSPLKSWSGLRRSLIAPGQPGSQGASGR